MGIGKKLPHFNLDLIALAYPNTRGESEKTSPFGAGF